MKGQALANFMAEFARVFEMEIGVEQFVPPYEVYLSKAGYQL